MRNNTRTWVMPIKNYYKLCFGAFHIKFTITGLFYPMVGPKRVELKKWEESIKGQVGS